MTLKAGESVHLLVEIAYADKKVLKSKKLIKEFLNTFPERIGMRLVSPAKLKKLNADDPIDSGISGTCILAESHCSIHAFENRGFAFIDIFSCKFFDTALAAAYIVEFFNAQQVKAEVVRRGELMDSFHEDKIERIPINGN